MLHCNAPKRCALAEAARGESRAGRKKAHRTSLMCPLDSFERGSLLKCAAPPLDLYKGLTKEVHPPPFTGLLSIKEVHKGLF